MKDKPAILLEGKDIPLVFTSNGALKRSIRKKYPNLNVKQWRATYDDQKEYVGIKSQADIEAYLDEKYEKYKKDNTIES